MCDLGRGLFAIFYGGKFADGIFLTKFYGRNFFHALGPVLYIYATAKINSAAQASILKVFLAVIILVLKVRRQFKKIKLDKGLISMRIFLSSPTVYVCIYMCNLRNF